MNTKPWVCSLPGLKLAKEFCLEFSPPERMFSYGPIPPVLREGACLPNWVNTGRRRTTCCNILPPRWMVKGSYLYLFGQVQLQEHKFKQVCHPMVPMSWVYRGNAMSISVEIRMSEDWHPAVDPKNTHDPSMESNHWNQPVMLIIYFKL